MLLHSWTLNTIIRYAIYSNVTLLLPIRMVIIKKWTGQNEQKIMFLKKIPTPPVLFLYKFTFQRRKYVHIFLRKCCYFLIFDWFLKGTFLWIVDNLACDQLEQIREILPKILSPILQLHGWWHIFAGYATYMHIIFCVCQVSNCVLVCTYNVLGLTKFLQEINFVRVD